MKKIISTFLAIVIVLGCVANGTALLKVNAAYTSGYYTYTIKNNRATITDCDTSISGKVTIPSTLDGYMVTAIGNDAFEECNRITAVDLGLNIESIGSYAFANCTGLRSIEITDNVTQMGERAFYQCTRLTAVIIGDGLKTIPQKCFEKCENLESLELGSNTTTIGAYAFSACASLSEIIFKNRLSLIEEYAFWKCTSLTSLAFPASMTEIKDYAFYDCDGLVSLNTGNGLKKIGRFAFLNCDALKDAVIGDNVINICYGAFMYCESLKNLVVGVSVETIENYAFSECHSLEKVLLPDSVKTIKGHAFNNCDSLIQVSGGKNIETIENYAFAYSEKLKIAEIPENVIEITDGMFLHCTSLEWVVINANLQTIGMNAFSECPSITDVFYSGSQKEWGYTVIDSGNTELNNADYHYYTPEPHYYHAYNNPEPTCINEGRAVYICDCGYTRYGVLSATGIHTPSQWIIDRKPTKTTPGSKHKACTACGTVLEKAAIPATANNFTDVFDSQVFKLWWSVAFSNRENIYEFSPKDIKWYTVDKIDLNEYYAGEKEVVNQYGSYSYTYSAIPADVFENEARKHFNITDINVLRDDTIHDPVYNAETNTYDMPFAGGWGDSITYVTKGYKSDDTGKYEVYGYTVEMAYEKPDDAVEGVDYIMHNDYPAEIVKCLKVTIEYNGTDVKFLSWETISIDEMPGIEDLIHNHISSDWITDKKATVNATGSKHKECTECGAVLETAVIPQLKPATPKLSGVSNTVSGVKVTWGKVSGADSYIVYRKTYNAKTKAWSGWSKAATVKGNATVTYTDKNVKSGTYYIYTVRAANEAGAGGYNTSGLKVYFLSMPTVTVANANAGVTVKWTKSVGATGYIVYRKTDNGKWTNLGKVAGTSFTDKKAKAGVNYKYTVKAYYSSYASAYNTSGVELRRLTTPKLSKVVSAKNGITFTWGKVTGASGYIIYRKTGNGSWQKIATVKGTSTVKYLDKTAKKGTTYTYTVRAYYGSSNSAYNTKGLSIKDKY